jgi:hypothetical protein
MKLWQFGMDVIRSVYEDTRGPMWCNIVKGESGLVIHVEKLEKCLHFERQKTAYVSGNAIGRILMKENVERETCELVWKTRNNGCSCDNIMIRILLLTESDNLGRLMVTITWVMGKALRIFSKTEAVSWPMIHGQWFDQIYWDGDRKHIFCISGK